MRFYISATSHVRDREQNDSQFLHNEESKVAREPVALDGLSDFGPAVGTNLLCPRFPGGLVHLLL